MAYPKRIPKKPQNPQEQPQDDPVLKRPATGFNPDDIEDDPQEVNIPQAAPQEPVHEQPASVPEEPTYPAALDNPPKPRKRKNAKVSPRRKADSSTKSRVQIYLSPEEKRAIDMFCASNGISITDLGADCMLSRVYASYTCRNPACGRTFTAMDFTFDGEDPAPAVRCPFCSDYTRISRTKPY